MASSNILQENNNLELYLNDVYEKECEYKIEIEEVEFIQIRVETLVQELVDAILTDDELDQNIANLRDREKSKQMFNKWRDKQGGKILVNLTKNVPKQKENSLPMFVIKTESYIRPTSSSVIKVGSFYDGTKNNFPDEFDFIFLLGDLRSLAVFIRYPLLDVVDNVCKNKKHLQYVEHNEKHQVTRKLELDKYADVDDHGPAIKLQFIYSNGFDDKIRNIHVDIVPAIRFEIDCKTKPLFIEEVKNHVEPETFREEILATDSCLIVGGSLAYTEIEQHFMKNILSDKHVKVYRILKYLLNGNGDCEKLKVREDLFQTFPHYTSYHIKILLFYHHDACTDADTGNLGPCVLQILEQMSKFAKKKSFPKFYDTIPFPGSFEVLPFLKSTIKTLQSMQTSEDSYNYERDKIKSVIQQYLDRPEQWCVLV